MKLGISVKKFGAVLLVFALLASTAAAAGGFGLNIQAEQYPEIYYQEDELTVASHDRGSMGWLQYEGDDGKTQTINAHVNGTDSGAKVGYRADQIQDSDLAKYPQVDSEDGNNSVTWLNHGNWSTSSSNVTVSDSDGSTASGVESIQIATSGTLGAGSSVSATYANQSITTDAEKRYLQLVTNVNSLESGAVVHVQAHDGDGDYVEATINASRNSSDADVITNSTAAKGVIYQEQLGQLNVSGTGDGTLNGIQEITVQVTDGDADVTITGLNVQKKSTWSFGEEHVLDDSTADIDDDYTGETVTERPEGGVINVTSLASMDDVFSDATVHQLTYYDVRHRLEDDPSAVSVEFSSADRYNYPQKLELTLRKEIQTAYDLSRGDIDLVVEQSFLSDRYVEFRYAEAVGDTDTADISDEKWTDMSGSLGELNKSITVDATVNEGETSVTDLTILLQDDQAENLQKTGGSGPSFWGDDGGSNPFMSLYNWVAAGIVGLLTTVGIKLKGV